MNATLNRSHAEAALLEYDDLLRPARDRFAAARGTRVMVSPDTGPREMAAFLLHFSGLSVPITEPVEGWIRRAGERCEAIGLPAIGRALRGHAKAEAGHHLYHVNDFATLTRFWNDRWSPPADPAAILAAGMTRGGEQYGRVHDGVIASDTPFCQLAIEYEIEQLPVEYGQLFVDNCVRLLGPEILDGMTFATSHIEFDVGHTKFNAHFLGGLLAERPDWLGPLAAAGAAALDAFADHLTECLERAERFGGAS